MKFLRLLFLGAALLAAPAYAADAPAPLYSFADVYRLTVGGPAVGVPVAVGLSQAGDAPIRVAVAEPAPESRFVIRAVPAPERWLLALAGLCLAGWVAHRRLSYL
jgi:hypothetical protein